MSEAICLLLFAPSCSIMACTGTSLTLPLLTDNLSDVLPSAVASQCVSSLVAKCGGLS